ncbi:tartronate semialdehyde reductase [Desulfosporosinus sp. OT]|nr:NAD(P)-dependent oxidoreductase [Desulfosporosinus sp. OT]EGW41004.1 tartronate semialdehyde reductase [Desulfosporosinus sp. OT]
MKVGFIGIGVMGKPMAKNILGAGYPLFVNDVNGAAVQELVAEGAKRVPNPCELAQEVDVIITMLPNGGIVEQVLLGEQGVFAGAKPGLTIIDMSSVAPTFTQKMAKKAFEQQLNYIDAPVSGGVKGAAEGTLTIMVGGEKELVERYQALLEVMGKKIYHVGKAGAGDAVKIVNNLLLGVNMAAAAEAFVLGTKLGLDPKLLLEIISVSSGNSYVLTAKMPNFVFKGQFEAGFAIDLQYKDLELAIQTAKEGNVPMILANVAQQVFEQARAAGLGREDISAVIKPLEDLLNIKVRV